MNAHGGAGVGVGQGGGTTIAPMGRRSAFDALSQWAAM